jgi:hypothetical protein
MKEKELGRKVGKEREKFPTFNPELSLSLIFLVPF